MFNLAAWIAALVVVVLGAQARDSQLPVRILPLGDSLSACTGLNRALTKGVLSYRYWLWKQLEEEGLSRCATFVGRRSGCNTKFDSVFPGANSFPPRHDAVFGFTSEHAVEEIDEIIRVASPTVALVLLGTNDMLLRNLQSSRIIENIERIITNLRNRGAEAVFVGAPPAIHPPKIHGMGSKMERIRMQLRSLQGKLHRLCIGLNASLGGGVFFVDVYGAISPTSHLYDGIHPNKRGAKAIARAWALPLLRHLSALPACAPSSSSTTGVLHPETVADAFHQSPSIAATTLASKATSGESQTKRDVLPELLLVVAMLVLTARCAHRCCTRNAGVS